MKISFEKMKERVLMLLVTITVSCVGPDGEIGPAGLNSLIKSSPETPGDKCPQGGFKIEVGIDNNNNEVLDSDEIQSTQYVCNGSTGPAGKNSLVKIINESPGIHCPSGGVMIASGIDSDEDGNLDDQEIQSTAYVCNASKSLIKMSNEPAGSHCDTGGLKLESGTDDNGNGILEPSEIQATQFICNAEGLLELRFDFSTTGNASWGTSTTDIPSNGLPGRIIIPKFNLSNYVGVDSVALGGMLMTSNAATTCLLELYDITHSKVVDNSAVTSNSTVETWSFSTTNFIDKMPAGPIDLTIMLSSQGGAFVQVRNPTLILIWKK